MAARKFKIRFTSKITLMILLVALMPLLILSYYVSEYTRAQYQYSLEQSFNRELSLRKQLLLNFLESNKAWIRSLTNEDFLLAEVDQIEDEEYSSAGLFAALVSIQRQNAHIHKVSILNNEGIVMVSTATDDVGRDRSQSSFFENVHNRRTPYVGEIVPTETELSYIPIAAPFIRKSDNQIIGSLLVEMNSSALKALFAGDLYIDSPIEVTELINGEAYVVDSLGTVLTPLDHEVVTPLQRTKAYQNCLQGVPTEGYVTNYAGVEVFQVAECLEVDDHTWVLVVEQLAAQAQVLSDSLRTVILMASALTGLTLVILMIPVSYVISRPFKALLKGAKELARGNYDYQVSVGTGDELQELAEAFNFMARKIKTQVERLDNTSKLLLRRDLELRKTNEELESNSNTVEAEHRKLELVISGISDGVIALNHTRQIALYNEAAAEIIGYETAFVLGKHISKILTLYDQNDLLDPEKFAPESDKPQSIVYRHDHIKLVGQNHKVSYVKLMTAYLGEGRDDALGWIITIHNVTEEEDLQRMKLDFASMAAHELRTPLTTVVGYLSFLQSEDTTSRLNEAEREFVNKAALSANRLNKLIENVLSVSKIEQGQLKLTPQPIQLENLIAKLVTEYAVLAETKKLQLIFTPPPTLLPKVNADVSRIDEVVSNLIGNAVKYTDKGSIEVTLQQQGDYIITSVSDTGRGIPNDAVNQLFTKFFRVQGELRSGAKGTGLGLYISKMIVEGHAGRIWVESVINQGSTFSFSLPIIKPGETPKLPGEDQVVSDPEPSAGKQVSPSVENSPAPSNGGIVMPEILRNKGITPEQVAKGELGSLKESDSK